MDHMKIKKAIEAAEEKARDLKQAISVAIVDEHGDLLAFSRMPEALKISPKFAITKAYTSGTLGFPTKDLGGYACEGKPYFGITTILAGKLTTIAGGVPVKISEKLVGGIGVGGSLDVTMDEEIAKAALAILTE